MRLFAAIEIPEAVRREIARRVEPLKKVLPRARWVNPAGMHLTLVFLGEVEALKVEKLTAALCAALAPLARFRLEVSKGGTFPPARPARVAWIGLGSGSGGDALAACHLAAEQACVEAVDYQPETRPFSPHVTVARCDPPWEIEEGERFTREFSGRVGESFEVDRAVLFESHLRGTAVRYTRLAELRLAGGLV